MLDRAGPQINCHRSLSDENGEHNDNNTLRKVRKNPFPREEHSITVGKFFFWSSELIEFLPTFASFFWVFAILSHWKFFTFPVIIYQLSLSACLPKRLCGNHNSHNSLVILYFLKVVKNQGIFSSLPPTSHRSCTNISLLKLSREEKLLFRF